MSKLSSPRLKSRFSDLDEGTLVLLAAAVSIGAFLVHEVYSLDVWWQAAIGRHILGSMEIPTSDTFSVAGQGRPYHDSHWLFQMVLGAADRVAGIVGVQLVMIGLWSVTLVICYRACRDWAGEVTSAVLVFVVAMASVERFLPRPELVTFLMVVHFYRRLQIGKHETLKGGLALAGMQAIWSNCHGLFVLGPFLVGSYGLEAVLASREERSRRIAAWCRALGLTLLGTLITPFGIDGWRYAALLVREGATDRPPVFQTLGELSGTLSGAFRASPAFWFFLSLLVTAWALAIYGLAKREGSPSRLLILTVMTVLAMSGRRNVVLLVVVAAPFIAEMTARLLSPNRSPKRWLAIAAALLMLLWSAYPLSGSFYIHMELPARFGVGASPSFFPHGLPAFLDEAGFDGRVLNSNTLGGFYLYHGFPKRLPLTDGRWEIYDSTELEWLLVSSRKPQLWREVVDRYGISGILLAHTSPEAGAILPEISRATDWRLVYLDQAASFWLSDASGIDAPSLSLTDATVLPPIQRIDDALILDSFLSGVSATGLQISNLERSLVYGARVDLVLERLGRAQIQAGLFGESQDTLERLIGLDPDNLSALNELAYLAYRSGDLERAQELMLRALEIQPGDDSLRENLGRIEAEMNDR